MDKKSNSSEFETETTTETQHENIPESENEKLLPHLVDQLRQLLKDESSLPENHRTDDEFLSLFIRVRHYDVQQAFISVKKTYKYMGKYIHLFEGAEPRSVSHAFGTLLYGLKFPSSTSTTIIVTDYNSWDPSQITTKDVLLSSGYFLQERIHTHKNAQIHGAHIIIDCDGLSWRHIKALSPNDIKMMVQGVQDGYPIRVIGVHIINYPSIFWILYYIASKFISNKMKERIQFHANVESLHQHFNPSILPNHLGGKLTKDEVADNAIIQQILERNDHFTSKPSHDFCSEV